MIWIPSCFQLFRLSVKKAYFYRHVIRDFSRTLPGTDPLMMDVTGTYTECSCCVFSWMCAQREAFHGFWMAFSWRVVQEGEGILRKLWQVRILVIRLLWPMQCCMTDFDFTDGLSNPELDFLHVTAAEQLQISPHRRPHCLFMGKYSLICSYPALSLSKWLEVFNLGRTQSSIFCCEMAERVFVPGGGACWCRCLLWLWKECSADT